MLSERRSFAVKFSTPAPKSRPRRGFSPARMPVSEGKQHRQLYQIRADLKVPTGDSPYVRAKQVQLIDKDPNRAISLFWSAINSGDRVDSALKDMAVVMKQLNRSDEAIEAVKSFRHLCPPDSQESLDNVLMELYKRSGRIDEQIDLLEYKLKNIDVGVAFGGRRTKIARSQGKKIQITIEQEQSRLLGNLAWAQLQKSNYGTAEELYRRALSLEPDRNKECNLAICLMQMNRTQEAQTLIDDLRDSMEDHSVDESCAKSFERALHMLEMKAAPNPVEHDECHGYVHGCSASCFGEERQTYLPNSLQDGAVEGTILLDEHGSRSYRSLNKNNPRTPLTESRRKLQLQSEEDWNPNLKSRARSPRVKSIRPWKMNSTDEVQAETPEISRLSLQDGKKSWADMVEEDDEVYGGTTYSSYEEAQCREIRGGNAVSPRKTTARRSLGFFSNQGKSEEMIKYSSRGKKAPSYGGCSRRLSFQKALHGIPHAPQV